MIALLAAVNYLGVRVGGDVQVVVTVMKVALIGAIIVAGLGSSHGAAANFQARCLPSGGVAGFFAALVAALWAYDGWNNAAMVGSEVETPAAQSAARADCRDAGCDRDLSVRESGVFLRVAGIGSRRHARVAGAMMRTHSGPPGRPVVSVAAMISIFAALNGSILSGSRVPFAMARDGLFFHSIGYIHPTFRTPGVSIVALNLWAALLVLSGRYDQLYTYVIFASVILYAMATASVIVLRYRQPDLPRPYRTLGYPFVPLAFVLGISFLVVSTLIKSPRESLMGLGIISLGLPFYFYWKTRLRARNSGPPALR